MRLLVLVLATACAGCESWTGFGFRAGGGEMVRLRELVAFESKVVADVGAGKGQLTFALAQEVGRGGHVFSTEIHPDRLRLLRQAKLANVTVLEAQASDTGLPANCCDAIVLRRVYHHLTDPSGFNASLLRALRPGGALVVIDFPPPFFLSRGSFGVPSESVTAEVRASGFELVRLIDDWPGRGPLGTYCALFRKPL